MPVKEENPLVSAFKCLLVLSLAELDELWSKWAFEKLCDHDQCCRWTKQALPAFAHFPGTQYCCLMLKSQADLKIARQFHLALFLHVTVYLFFLSCVNYPPPFFALCFRPTLNYNFDHNLHLTSFCCFCLSSGIFAGSWIPSRMLREYASTQLRGDVHPCCTIRNFCPHVRRLSCSSQLHFL